MTEGLRKLRNELHNAYALPTIIKIIISRRMGWACSPHGINTYKILVKEPKETRPLGRLNV
jgi:hypothetical protein